MTDPWDVLTPTKGDDARHTTAAAKGEATGHWELAEMNLSRLFAALHGDPTGATAARYGEPLNFKERLDRLERAGWTYFRNRCDQAFEADFEDIILLARMLSIRRNEIVHSYVRGIEYRRDFRQEGRQEIIRIHCKFFIVPPTYTDRKWNPLNQPSFIYASREIEHYAEWFDRMGAAALNLAVRLSGSALEPFGRKHPERHV